MTDTSDDDLRLARLLILERRRLQRELWQLTNDMIAHKLKLPPDAVRNLSREMRKRKQQRAAG